MSSRNGSVALAGAFALLAGAASLRGDISLGDGNQGRGSGTSPGSAGVSGFSDLSNRDYLERQESLALEKARRIKEAMRQMAEAMPSLPGAESKREPVTGVSDGNWYAERLNKIQHTHAEDRRRNAGFMERIGEGLDAWATKPIREGRPWESSRDVEDAEGFRPLEQMGKIANQLGETAHDLISLPQLDRTGEDSPARVERQPASEKRVGRPPFAARQEDRDLVAEAVPGRLAAAEKRVVRSVPAPQGGTMANSELEQMEPATAPNRGESLAERLSGHLRLSGRRSENGAGSDPVPPPSERSGGNRMARTETPGPEVGNGASRESAGEEKFELEDVVAPLDGGSGGRWKLGKGTRQGGLGEGLLSAAQGPEGTRLKGLGRLAGGGSREEAAMPEPSGALADDASLHVVRGTVAEFYPFGGDGLEPVLLPPGSLVRVMKSGGEWSGVETAQSGRGIIRSDQIRRARESEVLAGYVPERSAEPAKKAAVPGSPISVEIRSPASQAQEPPARKSPKLLGDGLLPPLMDEP